MSYRPGNVYRQYPHHQPNPATRRRSNAFRKLPIRTWRFLHNAADSICDSSYRRWSCGGSRGSHNAGNDLRCLPLALRFGCWNISIRGSTGRSLLARGSGVSVSTWSQAEGRWDMRETTQHEHAEPSRSKESRKTSCRFQFIRAENREGVVENRSFKNSRSERPLGLRNVR